MTLPLSPVPLLPSSESPALYKRQRQKYWEIESSSQYGKIDVDNITEQESLIFHRKKHPPPDTWPGKHH